MKWILNQAYRTTGMTHRLKNFTQRNKNAWSNLLSHRLSQLTICQGRAYKQPNTCFEHLHINHKLFTKVNSTFTTSVSGERCCG